MRALAFAIFAVCLLPTAQAGIPVVPSTTGLDPVDALLKQARDELVWVQDKLTDSTRQVYEHALDITECVMRNVEEAAIVCPPPSTICTPLVSSCACLTPVGTLEWPEAVQLIRDGKATPKTENIQETQGTSWMQIGPPGEARHAVGVYVGLYPVTVRLNGGVVDCGSYA